MELNSKNIYQRMIEVQKKVASVNKNETVKMFENDKGYKAVSHDDVAAALHLPLAEAGIVMLPDIESFETTSFEKINKYGTSVTWFRTDIKIVVKWINADNPEDLIASKGAAFALDTSDKSFAKAYSLALKIVLLKVHLLESRDGEEQRTFDEENRGERPPTPPKENKNQNKKPEEPKPAQELSQEQLTRMYAIASSSGWTNAHVKNFLSGKYKIKSSKELTRAQYDWFVDHMQKMKPEPEPDPPASAALQAPSEPEEPTPTPPPPPPAPEPAPPAIPELQLNVAPPDFVIQNSGDGYFEYLVGKKLKDIALSDLRTYLEWLNQEIKQSPPPSGMVALSQAKVKIKRFFGEEP